MTQEVLGGRNNLYLMLTLSQKFRKLELGDRKKIDDLEDAERVNEEKDDKPYPLPSPGRVPHAKPLPND